MIIVRVLRRGGMTKREIPPKADRYKQMKQFKTHSQTGEAKIELFGNTYKFNAQLVWRFFYQ